MTDPPRLDSLSAAGPTAADWSDLVAELDRWGEAGRVAPLWWRDDDATTATAALAGLCRIAGRTPLALAVIPALATADLARVLHDEQSISVLQHGWRHANRVPQSSKSQGSKSQGSKSQGSKSQGSKSQGSKSQGKKSEYPSGLSASLVAAEASAGRERLAALFGRRALPVFVPPWNRIAPELLPTLAEAGIAAVSTIASRKKPEYPAVLPEGLALIDTHVDLIDWKGGGRFIGTNAALGALVFWLRRFRLGDRGATRALGILTHHVIMNCETAAFLDALVALVAGHRAARWVDIAELLR